MNGGFIQVEGNNRDFTGILMNGGTIIIKGDCGKYTGNSMSGGRIYVHKNIEGIGNESYEHKNIKRGRIYEKGKLVFER